MSRWHGESKMRGNGGGGGGLRNHLPSGPLSSFFISTELRRQYFLNFQGSHELIPPAFRFPNLEPGGGHTRLRVRGQGEPMRTIEEKAWYSEPRIFKLIRSPRIDSKEPIPSGCVALAGWYDNPIPTRFLAPIDCLKISALSSYF
jgi:hypothetical protein